MGWAIGFIVLFVLVALITYLISRTGKAASDKLTGIAIDRLVKQECAGSSTNHGQFDIDLTKISDISWLDIATQGFSLENFSAKVHWRKAGNKCIYTIEATANIKGQKITKTSPEQTVEPCP